MPVSHTGEISYAVAWSLLPLLTQMPVWLELILCSLVSLASDDSDASLWLMRCSLVSLASDDSAARRSLVACSLASLVSSLGSHLSSAPGPIPHSPISQPFLPMFRRLRGTAGSRLFPPTLKSSLSLSPHSLFRGLLVHTDETH